MKALTEYHADMADIIEQYDVACLAGAKRQVVNVGELERLGGTHPTLTDPPIFPYLVLWDLGAWYVVLIGVASALMVLAGAGIGALIVMAVEAVVEAVS